MLARSLAKLLAEKRLSLSATSVDKQKSDFLARLLAENHLADSSIRHLRAGQLQLRATDSIEQNQSDFLGQHLMAEFITPRLDFTPAQFEKMARHAATLAGATILGSRFIQTSNGGVSGIVVIAESHFTVHYIAPNFVALDSYTCGEIDFGVPVDYFKRFFGATRDENEFKRGLRNTLGLEEAMNWEFLPGIAKKEKNRYSFFTQNLPHPTNQYGRHDIGEFYFCDPAKMDNGNVVLDALCDSLQVDAKYIKYRFVHQFLPQGVSGAVLAEGPDFTLHFSFHGWTEVCSYAAADLCVFGKGLCAADIMQRFAVALGAEKSVINTFARGFDVHADTSPRLTRS